MVVLGDSVVWERKVRESEQWVVLPGFYLNNKWASLVGLGVLDQGWIWIWFMDLLITKGPFGLYCFKAQGPKLLTAKLEGLNLPSFQTSYEDQTCHKTITQGLKLYNFCI